MTNLIVLNRLDAKCSEFFDICRDSYEKFQKSKAEFHEIKNKKFPKKWDDLLGVSAVMRESFASTIVFAALCLEAFIYDYAAYNISDSYARKYLDSLDFVSKWVVIPRLVTGKDFPRDSQAFELLGKLKTARNNLVHHKSRPIPRNEDLERVMEEIEKEDTDNTEDAYQAVIKVLTELRNLEDDEQRDKWWSLR